MDKPKADKGLLDMLMAKLIGKLSEVGAATALVEEMARMSISFGTSREKFVEMASGLAGTLYDVAARKVKEASDSAPRSDAAKSG